MYKVWDLKSPLMPVAVIKRGTRLNQLRFIFIVYMKKKVAATNYMTGESCPFKRGGHWGA